MKKVLFYTHDPMLEMFYDETEAEDYFGDDWKEEMAYVYNIPDELFERFKKSQKEFYKTCRELTEIREKEEGK